MSATAPLESPTADAAANQVVIEDAGPACKKITITIPPQAIDLKLQESMATLGHETVVPGFRKGKVPQGLLERRFGSSVRTETKNQLIAGAYAEAIEKNSLKPVGEPEPADGAESMSKLEITPGKPLTFSLLVEVVPEFTVPAFDGIEVKKPMLEINEKLIADELNRQRTLHGTPEKVESGFQEGDRIGGYASVLRNDEAEPFFRQDNVLVLMPSGNDGGKGAVLGLMIDGLHGLLVDKKVGDSITVETVGPEGHEREDVRGAKLVITFEIRVAEHVTPAEGDQVAAAYGLENESMLREQIKLALEHRRDEEQATAMREQAIEQLAEMIKVDLPQRMTAQQATRNLEQFRLELLSRGLNAEQAEEKLAEARGESEEVAANRLKRFFILHKLGEHFNVEVSEQEVNGRIASIAAQRGLRPEKLRTELAQSGRLGEVARMIRDQKAADRVVQQAKKSEVSAEEWNRIFEAKRKDAASKQPAAKSEGKKTTPKKPAEPKAEPKAESKPESVAKESKSEAPKKKPAPKKTK